MQMIYLISGEGRGAGKTTLARKLGADTFALAHAIRLELAEKYPHYPWDATDQETKDNTRIPEWGSISMREVMVRYGQGKCEEDPLYWVRKLPERLEKLYAQPALSFIAIDDIRKTIELEYLREYYGKDNIMHFHVVNPLADAEDYDNRELMSRADYLVTWQAKGGDDA